MVYAFLPNYASGANLIRKLGKKAYSMCLEYHRNLPDDAHVVDQIETLKLLESTLDSAVLPKFDSDDKPILEDPVLYEMQSTFEKSFKVRIELLALIKNNNLQAKYFETYYRVCKSFQSYSGFVECPEMTEGCEVFADFIKTNQKAAEMFRKDTGTEFEESKMTIQELVDLMQKAKSKVTVFRHRSIDIGEILKRSGK